MHNSLQKYGFVCLAAILFLQVLSCKETINPPDDLIPADEMMDILTVIYVSEVKAISHFDLTVQKNTYLKNYLYPAIFDSLGVEDNTFYHSYAWYEKHPQEFELIMDSVSSKIERMYSDSTATDRGESLETTYKELNRIERVKSRESKQHKDE